MQKYEMKLTAELKTQLNYCSKALWGTTSKWRKLLENGVPFKASNGTVITKRLSLAELVAYMHYAMMKQQYDSMPESMRKKVDASVLGTKTRTDADGNEIKPEVKV